MIELITQNRVQIIKLSPFPKSLFWIISIHNIKKQEIENIKHLLNPEQIFKSKRYINEAQQNKSILIQAITKYLISQQLNVPWNSINITTSQYGKPFIPGYPLHFNLSNKNNYAFFGINFHQSIGVDIEKINNPWTKIFPTSSLRYLSLLKSTMKDLNIQAFYSAYWSSIEAYFKALGTGFIDQSFPKLELKNYNLNKNELFFELKNTLIASYSDYIENHSIAACIL